MSYNLLLIISAPTFCKPALHIRISTLLYYMCWNTICSIFLKSTLWWDLELGIKINIQFSTDYKIIIPERETHTCMTVMKISKFCWINTSLSLQKRTTVILYQKWQTHPIFAYHIHILFHMNLLLAIVGTRSKSKCTFALEQYSHSVFIYKDSTSMSPALVLVAALSG